MLDLSLEQETPYTDLSFEERLLDLSRSWFSSARYTESMGGTSNEASVIKALSRTKLMNALFEVGMIGKKTKSSMVCF
jgi:hypothetical protein